MEIYNPYSIVQVREVLSDLNVRSALLDAAPGQLPQAVDTAWLAWLLWWNTPVQVLPDAGGWTLQAPADGLAEAALPADWLDRMIEQLAER